MSSPRNSLNLFLGMCLEAFLIIMFLTRTFISFFYYSILRMTLKTCWSNLRSFGVFLLRLWNCNCFFRVKIYILLAISFPFTKSLPPIDLMSFKSSMSFMSYFSSISNRKCYSIHSSSSLFKQLWLISLTCFSTSTSFLASFFFRIIFSITSCYSKTSFCISWDFPYFSYHPSFSLI